MNNLKKISVIVKEILTENEETRNSDMLLYVKVCETLNPTVSALPFFSTLLNLKSLNLPCFETVRRARQKVQEKNPHLAGNFNTRRFRAINENKFRKFARGEGNEESRLDCFTQTDSGTLAVE